MQLESKEFEKKYIHMVNGYVTVIMNGGDQYVGKLTHIGKTEIDVMYRNSGRAQAILKIEDIKEISNTTV